MSENEAVGAADTKPKAETSASKEEPITLRVKDQVNIFHFCLSF